MEIFFTLEEAADNLRVSEGQINLLIINKQLPTVVWRDQPYVPASALANEMLTMIVKDEAKRYGLNLREDWEINPDDPNFKPQT